MIPIDSIGRIIRANPRSFWKALGNGLLIGTGLGIVFGLLSYHESGFLDFGPGVSALGGGILGGAAGMLIGGVVGLFSSGETVCDVRSQPTIAQKRRLILQAL